MADGQRFVLHQLHRYDGEDGWTSEGETICEGSAGEEHRERVRRLREQNHWPFTVDGLSITIDQSVHGVVCSVHSLTYRDALDGV